MSYLNGFHREVLLAYVLPLAAVLVVACVPASSGQQFGGTGAGVGSISTSPSMGVAVGTQGQPTATSSVPPLQSGPIVGPTGMPAPPPPKFPNQSNTNTQMSTVQKISPVGSVKQPTGKTNQIKHLNPN
jgi:hypothetical protein